MKEYVYFCKNCRRLEADTADNRPFRCEECGGKFQPLHITVAEWKASSPEERKDIVNRSVRKEKPQNSVNKNQNSNVQADRNKINAGSNDGVENKKKNLMERISVGEEGKISTLAIVGFVLAFLGFFSIFGLAAGIIDLLKKDGRKKGLSIASICISGIVLLGSIGVAVGTTEEAKTEGIVAETVSEEPTEDNIITEGTNQESFIDDNLVVDTTNIVDSSNIVSDIESNDSNIIDVGDDAEIASAENAEESEPEVATRTLYATSRVKIREQPNTDCAVLGLVDIGQGVTEYEALSEGWSRISCDGVDGYIKSEYLSQDAPNTTVAQTDATLTATTAESVQNTPAPTQEMAAVATEQVKSTSVTTPEAPVTVTNTQTTPAVTTTMGTGSYVVNGENGKIHIVGGCSTPPTNNPIYVNSYEEAEATSIRVAPNQNKRKCGNCYK